MLSHAATLSEKDIHAANFSGIEKFEGSYSKEEFGVTIIPTKIFFEIKDPHALAVYCFLLSLPKEWKLSRKHLQNHFGYGRDKIRQILQYLIKERYISCHERRNHKGEFDKHHHTIHLGRYSPDRKLDDFIKEVPIESERTSHELDHPILDSNNHINNPTSNASTTVLPLPEIPSPVDLSSDGFVVAGKSVTYKTYNDIKHRSQNPSVDLVKKSTNDKDYKLNHLFMAFYNAYPNKQKPAIAFKAFLKHNPTPSFVKLLLDDLKARTSQNWKYRDKSKIPFPATYLNGREWEGEIFKPKSDKRDINVDSMDWDLHDPERDIYGI